MEYVFTCNKNYSNLALYELTKYDETFTLIEWLDDEVGYGVSLLEYKDMKQLIACTPIIFTRHIFKVDIIIKYDNAREKIVDLCSEKLKKNKTFCIQTRLAHGVDKKISLTENISEILVQNGYQLDVAFGEQIVSVFGVNSRLYVGISDFVYNISHWKGGMPHYSSTNKYGFVSRAEYKLREALESYNIDISKMKKGADLGAAPGGWTKVLSDGGIEVSSIDPSYLKKEIECKSNVIYYHMRVEEYLKLSINDKFDIVVNDMKMDVVKSINVINSFYEKIMNGGIVIMTFKLPHEFSYKNIRQHLNRFKGFEIIGCRQFFHNRSEITVVLKKNIDLKEQVQRIETSEVKTEKLKKKKVKGHFSKKIMRKYKK